MIVHRQEIRERLGGVLRKLTHQPANGPAVTGSGEPDLVDAAQQAEPSPEEPATTEPEAPSDERAGTDSEEADEPPRRDDNR